MKITVTIMDDGHPDSNFRAFGCAFRGLDLGFCFICPGIPADKGYEENRSRDLSKNKLI
jgi:hypothetical protein